MEKVLADLQSALGKLHALIAQAEKRQTELNNLIIAEKLKASKLEERETVIREKEAKYAQYDSHATLKAALDKEKSSLKAQKEALDKQVADATAFSDRLEAEQSRIEEQRALLKRKIANCDEQEAKLKIDKAEMRSEIIKDLLKSTAGGGK